MQLCRSLHSSFPWHGRNSAHHWPTRTRAVCFIRHSHQTPTPSFIARKQDFERVVVEGDVPPEGRRRQAAQKEALSNKMPEAKLHMFCYDRTTGAALQRVHLICLTTFLMPGYLSACWILCLSNNQVICWVSPPSKGPRPFEGMQNCKLHLTNCAPELWHLDLNELMAATSRLLSRSSLAPLPYGMQKDHRHLESRFLT